MDSLNGSDVELMMRKKEALERALEMYDDAVDVARTLRTLASVHIHLGEATVAISMLERSLAIYEDVHGSEHEEVAIALVYLATTIGIIGRDAGEQLGHFNRALRIAKNMYGSAAGHHADGVILFYRALAFGQIGDADSQQRDLAECLHIFDKFGKDNKYSEVVGSWIN